MKDLLSWFVVIPIMVVAVICLLLLAALSRCALGGPLNDSLNRLSA